MPTMTARTARKRHRCDSCARPIEPGDRYVRHVMFPTDDDYDYIDPATYKPLNIPLTLKECATEAERYGRGHLLERTTDG
jgi:hypothetical protein